MLINLDFKFHSDRIEKLEFEKKRRSKSGLFRVVFSQTHVFLCENSADIILTSLLILINRLLNTEKMANPSNFKKNLNGNLESNWTFRVNSFFSYIPVVSKELGHKKTGKFRVKTKNSGLVLKAGLEPFRFTSVCFGLKDCKN